MSKKRKNDQQESLPLQEREGGRQIANSTSLAPLQIIRTETVISRLPIHNLVKGGEVNIQISRKNEHGKLSLHWEVSPSSRFGHPGQLAYKIDTIIINRIIDEVGRPVPKYIKIGTLNQLCKELGSQKGELKKALQQNAATTISAKLRYKSKDGQERTLEAIFSRYSVVFTGETLPNGEKADEIYIIFNDPYLEVLNSAPIRPLNYEYLKELSPTSQRFYEIISYRIYAAVKYNHPQAKLLYSEYCTCSAQHRHTDFERARIQMYRVHKPHLESLYITKVDYEKCLDEDGQPDWLIYYTPGPKAKAEFHTFNRKQGVVEPQVEAASTVLEEITHEEKKRDESREVKARVDLRGAALVKYFRQLTRGKDAPQAEPTGKELQQAATLLEQYGEEKARQIVDFASKEARKTNFQMRTFGAVLQYVAEAKQHLTLQVTAQHRKTELEAEQVERLRTELDAYQQAEQSLEQLPDSEFRALHEKVKGDLFHRYPEILRQFDPEILETTIRAGMIRILMERGS